MDPPHPGGLPQLRIQNKIGANRGSWDPGGRHSNAGGRVVSTTLSVLSLEV